MNQGPKAANLAGGPDTPYVLPVAETCADDSVRGIFQEIRRYYGFVPNLYRTLAHYPPLLKANWQKIRAVMGGGPLTESAKEAIAVAVSRANDCEYCVRIHSHMLKKLRVSDAEIRALLQLDYHGMDFLDHKEKALVRFIDKVNSAAPLVEREDIEGLRREGASDAEIIHALGVMEVYISYNKTLVALRVAMERRDRVKNLSYPPLY